MKNKLSRKSDVKNREKVKKATTYIVIGVILFAMIFSCFSYLIYALQTI